MPRPLYIFCATDGALDQYTNSLSLYGLVESITYGELKARDGAESGIPVLFSPLWMRIAAAWLKEDGDSSEQRFEAEVVGLLPGTDEVAFAFPFPSFTFKVSIHRLIVPKMMLSPDLDMKPGLLRLVNRLRRAEKTEWEWSQEYAILVEEERKDAAAPPATPHTKPPAPQADTSG